ncbi:DUF397 domain-containing protein [Streptomyces sp. NPDC052682]|uniref:DUF397 domain-containing protein n=1 Tax=Streptomyces sp. NPDC052682 TaxID=3154954 RepID=UPI003435699E
MAEAVEVEAIKRGGSGGDCLEVAEGHPALVPVRDSKNPHGPKLVFRAETWAAFVANLKDGAA